MRSAAVVAVCALVGACSRSDISDEPSMLDGSTSADASPPTKDAANSDATTVDSSPGSCTSCVGCCEGDTCISLANETASMCGFSNVACHACASKADQCVKGACMHPQPNCGTSNCAGCCVDANNCSDGLSADACGFGGAECQGCGKGACVPTSTGGSCGSTCGPGNCKGCCDNGKCLLGQSDSSCGNSGDACVACKAPETCLVLGPSIGGTCRAPCSTSTCAGCCDGEVCAVGDQDIACGVGGEACADCTPHKCVSGKCSP